MKNNIMFFKYLNTFYAIYTTFTPLQDRYIYIGILTYNIYVHTFYMIYALQFCQKLVQIQPIVILIEK